MRPAVEDRRRSGGSRAPAAPSARGAASLASAPVNSPAVVGLIHGTMDETLTPGGVRVLTESIPGVRSVSVGVWVRQGSAHEPPELYGASHLLEHLVFKGSATRTPHQIAMALERLGGSLDAFTSREHTSYQARVLSEHLPVAMDVLSDLVRNPLLREADLELEREVVLEEIATVEDVPDDLVFELHGERLWGDHPYGHSILGTADSVRSLPIEALREIHERRYLEGELIVAAAGHLEHERVVEMVERHFSGTAGDAAEPIPWPQGDAPIGEIQVERSLAQSHIVVGSRTPPRTDAARFPLVLVSSAFGGGMSSRLFQRIREELAMAYSVYSFQAFHSRGGSTGVYVGTRPGTAGNAIDAVLEEYQRLASEGLTVEELRKVKDQVKGQVMLSLESTSSRLFRLAGFALYDQPRLTLDELLQAIETVSIEDVADVSARFFDPERQTILRLGPGHA